MKSRLIGNKPINSVIKNKPSKTTSLGRYGLHSWPTRLVSSLVVVGITLLLLTASSGAPNSAQSTSKPAKSAAKVASAPTCTETPPPIGGAPFANCPSLSLNFATMSNGPLSTDNFNIYTGKPEANQEAQFYTANQQNLRIENGSLVLRALSTPQDGFKYTSARIDTKNKQDFLYGKLVVRATLPAGTGTWPAIWMLPTDKKYENLSPPTNFKRYLNDGEIDIAEAVGTQPNVVYGIAHSLAHPADGYSDYFSTVTVPGNDTAFHDYGVNWTPTNLTFTIDGRPYYSMSKQPGADYRSWPYDQRYYLILNLALGGTWGGTDRAHFPADGVDPSVLPATMKIQSINYYPYKPQSPKPTP